MDLLTLRQSVIYVCITLESYNVFWVTQALKGQKVRVSYERMFSAIFFIVQEAVLKRHGNGQETGI